MTGKDRRCRKCLLAESSPEDFEKYIGRVLRGMKPEELAPEEIYRRRLLACQTCGKLSGATCMSCGCLVELRAALKEGKCPEASDGWNE